MRKENRGVRSMKGPGDSVTIKGESGRPRLMHDNADSKCWDSLWKILGTFI